eukprot:g77494.t1
MLSSTSDPQVRNRSYDETTRRHRSGQPLRSHGINNNSPLPPFIHVFPEATSFLQELKFVLKRSECGIQKILGNSIHVNAIESCLAPVGTTTFEIVDAVGWNQIEAIWRWR